MLKSLRDMIRRIGFVGGVLLTLAFALPALASHACASELSPPVAETIASTDLDGEAQCPDCGPACVSGCCHAPHAATPADVGVEPKGPVFAAPVGWVHATGRLLHAPAGPERPPRL
ncbi:MAG: hypothetical protein KKG14_12500 [Alphaproteobacteria bacterium]|nr:hypothetical protein [Alphaproteobacteria bacterium]MBU2272077.1 hypothetical protein [Alphaproteobacteria bacterium]MBU2419512.1 hypothetical protein [Alphaproteobacteria bacterium]